MPVQIAAYLGPSQVALPDNLANTAIKCFIYEPFLIGLVLGLACLLTKARFLAVALLESLILFDKSRQRGGKVTLILSAFG